MDCFNVVITGVLLPGHNLGRATADLARLIKRDPSFAAGLLRGRATKVKSGVDAATGGQYVLALERVGVAARLEPETLEIDADLVAPSESSERNLPRPPAAISGARASTPARSADEADDPALRGRGNASEARPTVAAPKRSSRVKPIMAFPNVLFAVLLLAVLFLTFQKNGVSPFAFRGAAASYGEATALFLIPLGLGIAWNAIKGEARTLKWIYVAATSLFIIVALGAEGQRWKVTNAQQVTTVTAPHATSSVEQPPASETAKSAVQNASSKSTGQGIVDLYDRGNTLLTGTAAAGAAIAVDFVAPEKEPALEGSAPVANDAAHWVVYGDQWDAEEHYFVATASVVRSDRLLTAWTAMSFKTAPAQFSQAAGFQVHSVKAHYWFDCSSKRLAIEQAIYYEKHLGGGRSYDLGPSRPGDSDFRPAISDSVQDWYLNIACAAAPKQ